MNKYMEMNPTELSRANLHRRKRQHNDFQYW
jgi:hypothetical protein